eukprot:858931-Ditylum_brightwellii.AAC.1
MILVTRGSVGGSTSSGGYNDLIRKTIGEEVLQCSSEEVERWHRRWCVCCCHLSLPLGLPEFGICAGVVGRQSSTTTT